MNEIFFIYLGIGALTGVLASLLGVGGGLVFVPSLFYCFRVLGFDQGLLLHLALGTSLAAIFFISLSSIRSHHRRGALRWPLALQLAPGILLGTLFGALVADHLSTLWLQRFFALFAIGVGLQMLLSYGDGDTLLNTLDKVHLVKCHRNSGRLGQSLAGAVIGLVSALTGIGGGSLTVPFLTACRVPIREAVATSSACGLPIALAGTAGYLWTGWNHPLLPPQSFGYIHWPAVAGLAIAGVLSAPFGAYLAHTLPTRLLKRFFGLLLVILGARMISLTP